MIKKTRYKITEVKEAKQVATDYLKSIHLDKAVDFGLPEIDDRYHIWRVPILSKNKEKTLAARLDDTASTSPVLLKQPQYLHQLLYPASLPAGRHCYRG